MHCEDPPCRDVCPTGATYRRNDGIVEIDEQKCIGCGYCIVTCPYDARTIYRSRHTFDSYGLSEEEISKASTETREGVCTKCNFCRKRIENGLKRNLQPGVDLDATPACVLMCSSGALYFGDLDDPNSKVSQLLKNRKVVRISTGVETSPSVYYLTDI
jgi:phenylacetyl-CoA:acceptor oxidoreductase subunit 1